MTLDQLIKNLCEEQQLRQSLIRAVSLQQDYEEWEPDFMYPVPFENAQLNHVYQEGIKFALCTFAIGYMGAKSWEAGDGSETVEGDVLQEFSNIFKAAGLVNDDGDPISGDGLRIMFGQDVKIP